MPGKSPSMGRLSTATRTSLEAPNPARIPPTASYSGWVLLWRRSLPACYVQGFVLCDVHLNSAPDQTPLCSLCPL
jgi:hypothetical protein